MRHSRYPLLPRSRLRPGEVSDAEVARAIRSVPCHHAGGMLLGVDAAAAGGGGAQSTHSLSFDGSGQVSIPSGLLGAIGMSAGSIAGWIKPTSSLSGYESIHDTSGRQLSAFLGGAASHLYLAGGGGGGNEIALSDSWMLSTWQHYAVTWDNVSSRKVYRNGVQVGSDSGGGIGVAAEALLLGANPSGGGAGYIGLLDHFAVWSVVLSGANITGLAAGSTTVDSLTPLGFWPFETGSGTSAADSSGNGYTGTLSGGVTWSTDVPAVLM